MLNVLRVLAWVSALTWCVTAGVQAQAPEVAAPNAATPPAPAEPAPVQPAQSPMPSWSDSTSIHPNTQPWSYESIRAGFAPLGCEAREVLSVPPRFYAACGRAGVMVAEAQADGSLHLIEQRQASGQAQSLYLRGDAVWIETTHVEARPVTELPLVTAGTSAPAAAPPSPPAVAPSRPLLPAQVEAEGRVLSLGEREITISMGFLDGLRTGDHIEVIEHVDPSDELGARERSVLVGEVSEINEHRARVSLGLGESAQVGQRARKTTRRVSASRLAPPRVGGLWMYEGTLRPFLPADTLAFAMLGDLAITYLPEASWYVRGEIQPIGGLWGAGRNARVFGASLGAGYDQTYFAVGLALGSLFRGEVDGAFFSDGRPLRRETGTAFAVTQSARLGARDGLRFSIANRFALVHRAWEFGSTDVSVQVPVGSRTWLAANGGGGRSGGYFFTEIGLRRLVRGNGGSGSWFIRPSVGIAGIDNRTDFNAYQMGPMVGLHIEARH